MVKFKCSKDYKTNFKILVNSVPITVVVPESGFKNGDTITLEPIKRTTGEGYYLRQALLLESITLTEEKVDTSKVVNNKFDLLKMIV